MGRWQGDDHGLLDQPVDRELPGLRQLGAPRDTPAEVIARLNAAVNEGLRDAGVRRELAGLGATAMPGSAAEFGRFVASETARYADVIRLAGIRPG